MNRQAKGPVLGRDHDHPHIKNQHEEGHPGLGHRGHQVKRVILIGLLVTKRAHHHHMDIHDRREILIVVEEKNERKKETEVVGDQGVEHQMNHHLIKNVPSRH